MPIAPATDGRDTRGAIKKKPRISGGATCPHGHRVGASAATDGEDPFEPMAGRGAGSGGAAPQRRLARYFVFGGEAARGWLVVLFLGWALIGCEDERPIRIGINPWPGYEFLYLAAEKGFFEQECVSVRLVEFSSLGDVRRAYERGQVDGMACTLIEAIQAWELTGQAPKVVYVCDFSDGGDVVLAEPGVGSVKELKGKRVGVEAGSVTVYVLYRALEKAGLTLGDVEIVSMDQMEMEQAFSEGRIEAAVSYPPVSTRSLRREGVKVLFSSREIPGEVVDVVVVNPAVVDERVEEVSKIGRAFDRAVAYSLEHPEESYELMARRLGILPEEFAKVVEEDLRVLRLGDQGAYFTTGGLLETAIQSTGKVMMETGQIKSAPEPPAMVAEGLHETGPYP